MSGENMKWNIAPAALLTVTVASFTLGAGKAEAVPVLPPSLTFGYSGTISSVSGPDLGLHSGDAIAGTLTFVPLDDSFTSSTTTAPPPSIPVTTTTNTFAESGTFSFGVPGNPIEVTGVSGTVDSSLGDFLNVAGLNFNLADGANSIALNSGGFFSSRSPLTSLTQLPADSTGLATFFGALVASSIGHINYLGSQIDFGLNVEPLAATPIPATVWLFASALGGLGLLGWMRRHAVGTAAP
jgi:hypothetical protein